MAKYVFGKDFTVTPVTEQMLRDWAADSVTIDYYDSDDAGCDNTFLGEDGLIYTRIDLMQGRNDSLGTPREFVDTITERRKLYEEEVD